MKVFWQTDTIDIVAAIALGALIVIAIAQSFQGLV